jgi:hypothetical protein
MKPRNFVPIGPLGKGSRNVQHFIPKRQDFDVPERVTNASSRELFTGTVWNIRQGGEDHKRFRSKGLG